MIPFSFPGNHNKTLTEPRYMCSCNLNWAWLKPRKVRKFTVLPLQLFQLRFWGVCLPFFLKKIARAAVLLIFLCLLISSRLFWTAAVQVLHGPIDAFFFNPTHYSCQVINELVPHVSLALACDLYFQGCFISLLTSALTPPVLLLCLPVHSPWGCSSPPASWRSQLVCCLAAAAAGLVRCSACPRAQGSSLREDWHELLVVMDAHLTSSDSGIFFQAVTLFEQIAFV